MKEVEISIKGIQNGEGIDDGVEFRTEGQYDCGEDAITFAYEESELTGMKGTKTTFTITDEGVSLKREGGVNAIMMFQEGRKHNFLYNTPYGGITMGVDTYSILNDLDEFGGNLVIRYGVDMDGAQVSRNTFQVNIREAR
jgi:uncharacterized beta-barrel protein YwiB (DUF1934 family)